MSRSLALLLAALLAACRSDRPPFRFAELVVHGGGDGPLPVVVLVHGLGATPASLLDLYEDYPHPLRVVAPEGPAPYGPGFAWYDPPWGGPELFPGDREAELSARADELARFIGWVTSHREVAGRPVIAGFSQGGMSAFAVAALHPELVAGAIPIGGNLPTALVPAELPPVPVWALHGGADDRVGVDTARAAVDAMKAAGADARLEVFEGVGHSITRPMQARLFDHTAAWLHGGGAP